MKNISECLSENFEFLVVKFTTYLNRRVFLMQYRMSIFKQSVLRAKSIRLSRIPDT